MKRNEIKRGFKVLWAVWASLTIVGCGKSPEVNSPTVANLPAPSLTLPIQGYCGVGSYPLASGCVQAADFRTACLAHGSGTLIYQEGVELCRLSLRFDQFNGEAYFSRGSRTPLPRLSPDDPLLRTGYNTGIPVYYGDRLSFSGGGGWGSTSVSAHFYLEGLQFYGGYTYQTHCNQVNLSGQIQGVGLFRNTGHPAGLYATDGVEVFPLRTGVSRIIRNNGVLRIGFNMPNVPDGCSNLRISRLQITRCFDGYGNTYTCQ